MGCKILLRDVGVFPTIAEMCLRNHFWDFTVQPTLFSWAGNVLGETNMPFCCVLNQRAPTKMTIVTMGSFHGFGETTHLHIVMSTRYIANPCSMHSRSAGNKFSALAQWVAKATYGIMHVSER